MSGCTDIQALLGALARGEPPDEEADRVAAHLDACDACGVRLQALGAEAEGEPIEVLSAAPARAAACLAPPVSKAEWDRVYEGIVRAVPEASMPASAAAGANARGGAGDVDQHRPRAARPRARLGSLRFALAASIALVLGGGVVAVLVREHPSGSPATPSPSSPQAAPEGTIARVTPSAPSASEPARSEETQSAALASTSRGSALTDLSRGNGVASTAAGASTAAAASPAAPPVTLASAPAAGTPRVAAPVSPAALAAARALLGRIHPASSGSNPGGGNPLPTLPAEGSELDDDDGFGEDEEAALRTSNFPRRAR